MSKGQRNQVRGWGRTPIGWRADTNCICSRVDLLLSSFFVLQSRNGYIPLQYRIYVQVCTGCPIVAQPEPFPLPENYLGYLKKNANLRYFIPFLLQFSSFFPSPIFISFPAHLLLIFNPSSYHQPPPSQDWTISHYLNFIGHRSTQHIH